jgi:hypothetical protein
VIRCGEWIGIVVCDLFEAAAFKEIASGWHGGATLSAAVEPARHLATDSRSSFRAKRAPARKGRPAAADALACIGGDRKVTPRARVSLAPQLSGVQRFASLPLRRAKKGIWVC